MPTRVQRIAERRIVFAPVAAGIAALAPPGPVALLGSRRSLALLADDAFGGATPHRFDGVRPHTPRATVDAARALVRAHACESVVAIGSSSAIDLAKAVVDGSALLLVAVPTALGGAEMSRGYGVLEDDRKVTARGGAPPHAVVYDASLLASLAPRELASIGINAWAHAIEGAYARSPHVLGAAAARAAGQRLPALLERARDERDAALHLALFEASHLAGFALDTRSMGLHHAICHAVGGLTQIPHGIVNAIVLPHAIRANERLASAAVAAVEAAFGVGDLAIRAEAIAAAFELPRTFAELGIPPGLVARALPRVMESPLLDNNPVRPDEATVAQVLAAAEGR